MYGDKKRAYDRLRGKLHTCLYDSEALRCLKIVTLFCYV